MITGLLTARAIYRVSGYAGYRQAFTRALARQRAHGWPIEPHQMSEPVMASVNHGRWIASCLCGSGMGVDPDWPDARCFECGAVYPVVFPVTSREIDAVLSRRPLLESRNWGPTETIDTLRQENAARGIGA